MKNVRTIIGSLLLMLTLMSVAATANTQQTDGVDDSSTLQKLVTLTGDFQSALENITATGLRLLTVQKVLISTLPMPPLLRILQPLRRLPTKLMALTEGLLMNNYRIGT